MLHYTRNWREVSCDDSPWQHLNSLLPGQLVNYLDSLGEAVAERAENFKAFVEFEGFLLLTEILDELHSKGFHLTQVCLEAPHLLIGRLKHTRHPLCRPTR